MVNKEWSPFMWCTMNVATTARSTTVQVSVIVTAVDLKRDSRGLIYGMFALGGSANV